MDSVDESAILDCLSGSLDCDGVGEILPSPSSPTLQTTYGPLTHLFPPSLLHTYRTTQHLKSLFTWQISCLQNKAVLAGRSLLFSAPTGAGKTVVSDLLWL